MILKALYDYYNRVDDLAPAGLEYKEIAFIIVIDFEGNFIRFEDRRIDKKSCQKFLVAQHVSRTSGVKANLLWDNSSYVLGIYDDESKKDKSAKSFKAFKDKIEESLNKLPDNKELLAVNKFYQKDYAELLNTLKSDRLWSTIEKNQDKNLSFMINGGKSIIAENIEIIQAVSQQGDDNQTDKGSICLITGKRSNPTIISTATSIPGSQATAKLVSFQINSGYDSYGKSQGTNAPISIEANFAFTTALNRLLDKNSKNKFTIGDRTYLFWASSKSEASKLLEENMFSFLGNNFTEEDDPNSKIDEIRNTFIKIYSGDYPSDSNDKFYILGLAPRKARIAVVYWQEISVKKFAENIVEHFKDMELVDNRPQDKRKPYSGLHAMMSAVTLGGKSSDVQPNLPDATIKSIMEHTPYPIALYNADIRRIRAEQNATITRIAILKAYLNRITNYNNIKLNTMLDKDNNNQGYLCGRLFAVLEYIQYRANKQNTIKERYQNAASATPASVFPTLMNLSVHHAEKLSEGANIYCEKLKAEIIQDISANGFPTHLDLNDQGRFFVGYYHQRQALFAGKADTADSDNSEQE
jgi:CRISPR-associated protein Csd1